jgi:arsenate reductase (glutaredoxin)
MTEIFIKNESGDDVGRKIVSKLYEPARGVRWPTAKKGCHTMREIVLFGIPNCDNVKKARALLDGRGIAYAFHDYKKLGVPEDELRRWIKAKGRDVVLNRKGTTWRALDEVTKASVVDDESAIRVMLANTSTIKRPIIARGKQIIVGVDATEINAL